ncbi:MAG: glycosyltransferase [bacterium]
MTTSVIQALATGLPVIATKHSGFPDQIEDGRNGFLVEEGDYDALAEKILFYMDHTELWGNFGVYGRKLMEEKYDCKKLIEKQIDYYYKILS